MKRLLTFMGLFAAIAAVAQQQEPWTLQQCIAYAQEHNISIQQQGLTAQQAQIDLETAKWDFAPSVSASASQNFTFGRSLSSDNTYVNKSTGSTGLNLGASMNLFSGLRTLETMKLRALDLETANANLLKARNDVSMNVAAAYIKICYDMEVKGVAQRQVQIDSLQVERLQEMLVNGKTSAVQVSQQKATLEQSRYTLTQACNTLSLDLLTLTQLLELPSPEGFSIVPPGQVLELRLLENPESIYAQALSRRPEVRAEEIRLDSYSSRIKIAQSAYYPSLTLQGGIGTNYYNTKDIPAAAFGDQLRNNFSQFVGLSLSVPIFNKMSTRNAVRNAKIARHSQELQLQYVKNQLYKEIQQAYYNAVAAQSRYTSSMQAAKAANESFEMVQAKYENGKATITEFNESKNAALKSESDLAQARCEWLYQAKLLEFYKGVEF